MRKIGSHGATEDKDDDGDGNVGRQRQQQCRRWTTMADSDGDGDGDGDGDVADGQQRQCWTATVTAITQMGNDADGGRQRQWR